jgi:uncharacterized protein GlcG (DUF336 family)
VGWGPYEACLDYGAIIATAHEHSYSRTKTLTSTEFQTVDPGWPDPGNLAVRPGGTFVFVSGISGSSIRDQERCLPTTYPYGCNGEWASIYTSNQNAEFGALFIEFHVDGNPRKARGYFKNVLGEVIDQFTVWSGGGSENSTVTATPAAVPADGTTAATVTVTLLDDAGAPVVGHVVSLGQGDGSSVISAPSGPSDSDGVVTFTVTSAVAETVTYGAVDQTDGLSVVQTAQVTFGGPTDADLSTVTAEPSVLTANGTTTTTITVTLVDGDGAPVKGHVVAVDQGPGSSVISSPSGTSDQTGQVTFTATSEVAETVTYTATDVTLGVELLGGASVTFEPLPDGVAFVEARISADPDDAEESASSRIDLTSTDLELVDYSGGPQTVGMRFNYITIPQGAEITYAYLQFQVDEADSGTILLAIQGEATDHAETFADIDGDISSRPRRGTRWATQARISGRPTSPLSSRRSWTDRGGPAATHWRSSSRGPANGSQNRMTACPARHPCSTSNMVAVRRRTRRLRRRGSASAGARWWGPS